jgi:hypothetical protein
MILLEAKSFAGMTEGGHMILLPAKSFGGPPLQFLFRVFRVYNNFMIHKIVLRGY